MDKRNKLHKLFFVAFLSYFACISTASASTSVTWPTFLMPHFDAGIMAGYTGGPRRGMIINPVGGSITESGSQDSSEIGLQMRLLFGSECDFRPFLYLNGAKSLGTPLSILLGLDLAPFTNATKLTFTTNWLARLGMGISSPWLYDRFQLGAGVGAAMMNQTLETYLGQTTTTHFQQTDTTVRPSLMGTAMWSLCSKCLMGHEALLTAEVTADHNPAINDNVPSNIGMLNTRVTQAWVFRGDLVFSVSLS